VPPLFTEPGHQLHSAEEIGIDDFQASRSPEGKYRTTPLRGLFARAKGGFYHDGRFADLPAVVRHYEGVLKVSLSEDERRDLVEYLKSL
jgi:cytochrome c peroxidase